jgi:hypothetical protein
MTSSEGKTMIEHSLTLRLLRSFAAAACFTALGAGPSWAASQSAPSALLAVDQNRATVIDRIVADWGEALVKANAGINAVQLRTLLDGMRADHLLAASLAGSLDGLREVLGGALPASKSGSVDPKALGDTGADIVYTPVTPCRLVETRVGYAAVYAGAGPFTGGEVRTYTAAGGNAVCLSQLPASLHPSALQLQVFGLPINASANGDIEVLPQGAAFGNTATLVYLGSVLVASASTTALVNIANNQISVQVRGGGANVAIDVVGYFAPPVSTALQCISVPGGSTVIALSNDTLVPLPACGVGYTRTGSSCSGTANVPGGYLVETNSNGCLFRNLSAFATYNATATSTCCRLPGR